MSEPAEVTRLLERLRAGDAAAGDELAPRVYDVLRGIAAGTIRRFEARATLEPTALVHEAWLRVLGPGTPVFADREHFLAVAARAMRNLLVDHARARAAQKRGGGAASEELNELCVAFDATSTGVLDLHEALERLAALDPQGARIVELRFFGGLANEEIARLLAVSSRTVERSWRTARAWLFAALVDRAEAGEPAP